MGYQDDGAIKGVDGLFDLFNRGQVEMVRWFVQHQQVAANSHEQRQHQTRPLARRQRGRWPVDVLCTNAKLGEQRARFADDHAAGGLKRSKRRLFAIELRTGLFESADFHG